MVYPRPVDLDALKPVGGVAADPAVMPPADRHQPLADVGAAGHRHAKTHRRVLMDEAPVGAREKTEFGLAKRREIARDAVAHPVEDAAGFRRKLPRKSL